MTRWSLAIALILCAAVCPAFAQQPHLLVITGVSGDQQFADQYKDWASAIVDTAKKRGVADANMAWLAENPDVDPERIEGRSSRENVTKAFQALAANVKAADDVFIVLIGHGSFDGRTGSFNLPGPDLSAEDYAGLLKAIPSNRVAFINTAGSSGAFLPTLAGPGRAILTATKTGGERNDTRFTGFFVEALNTDAADLDRNGRVSMLEAFNYTAAKVKEAYEKQGTILTEHATLEDNHQGQLAASMFLTPARSQTLTASESADPEFRALVEKRDALERQVTDLRLQKDLMDPARYAQELETLLTSLAMTTREIRDHESQRAPTPPQPPTP